MTVAYKPRADAEAVLDAAWGYAQSVPYQVSARWIFYRLLQDGFINKKDDYKRVISLLSTARKRFYKGWRPDILADDTRAVDGLGGGYMSMKDWLDAAPYMVHSYVDRWKDQDNYVLVCFEAAAMSGQFQFYLPSFVTRVAFKGDVSIPAKWKLAELITRADELYEKPVTLLYFGDLDPKGLIIPESAVNDIRDWAKAPFDYRRIALSPGDESRYDIAENPERPGTYQWEALDDDTAGTLITSAINDYIDRDKEDECKAEDRRRLDALRKWWRENGPSMGDLGLNGATS